MYRDEYFVYLKLCFNNQKLNRGLQNGRAGGWQVKFYPYKKGDTKRFEVHVVLTRELEILAIVN